MRMRWVGEAGLGDQVVSSRNIGLSSDKREDVAELKKLGNVRTVSRWKCRSLETCEATGSRSALRFSFSSQILFQLSGFSVRDQREQEREASI